MARYSTFLGRRVEVQYRAGDILLPASGIFVADSGRSIFLEQNFMQRGQHKHFRWEIPYQCIVRLEEKPDEAAPVDADSISRPASKSLEFSSSKEGAADPPGPGDGVATTSNSSAVLPLGPHPKVA